MKEIIYINKERKAVSTSFLLHYMGIHEIMPAKFINRPFGTDCYLFVFFYDAVDIRLDQAILSCPKNTFVLWKPFTAHYFGTLKHPWDHSWFYWDGAVAMRYFNQCNIPFNQPVNFSKPTLIDKYLLQIHDELSRHFRADDIIVRNCLHTMIREIKRVRQQEQEIQVASQKLLEIRRYLDMNFNTSVSLNDLSGKFYLSVPYLCAQFKKCFRVPPIEYLIQLRMQQVLNLMNDQDMTISQIAQKVGYLDPFYFSKTFKKRYGLSPREYRATMLSKNQRPK